MSINSLTNLAMSRRPDFQPADSVPSGYAEIAAAAGSQPSPATTSAMMQAHVGLLKLLSTPSAVAPEVPLPDDVSSRLKELIHSGVAPIGSDVPPADAKAPTLLGDLLKAGGQGPPQAPPGAPPASAPLPPSGASTALQTITSYIPTEILTLYVAAIGILGPLSAASDSLHRWLPFWCFLAATPLVVWLVFATKLKSAGKPIPIPPPQWPLWEMFAGTLAYFAWAFALPDSPFNQYHWYSSGIAGFLVLVVSAGLGLFAPLMQRPLNA